MSNKEFDWLGNTDDNENEEFKPYKSKKSRIEDFMTMFFSFCDNVFALTLVMRLITYISGFNPLVTCIRLNAYLNEILVILGSLIICRTIKLGVVLFVIKLGYSEVLNSWKKVIKLIVISTWCGINIYWLKLQKDSGTCALTLFYNIFICFMITSVTYSVTSISMIYFKKFFLKQTLYSKIKDVEKSEKILNTMKNYRYNISEPVSPVTPECNCRDLFCYRNSTSNHGNTPVEQAGYHYISTNMQVQAPEIYTSIEAKTLAKDVFTKACENNEDLNFEQFAKIFSKTEDSLNAFSFFDSNNDRIISKKEFKNTIIYFYMERINLEKNIKRSEDFVKIVTHGLNFILGIVLFFIYLVVFGAPLKELLALALSSALALNFVASGIAADLYYNFMMVVNHQFDVGDDVTIDDVDYRVYEFGLTSTSLICENGGKIKMLNSNLWKRKLINMTRAPEKIMVFNFELKPEITTEHFIDLKAKISAYLRTKQFDFDDTFSLQATGENFSNIDKLACSLILKCKSYKNKSKKFVLRVEVTSFLNKTLKEMGVFNKNK